MIINSQVKVRSLQASETFQNETEFLEEEIFDEQKRMVRIKNEIDKTEQEDVVIKGNVQLLLETIEKLIEEVAEHKNQTVAATGSIEQLQFGLCRHPFVGFLQLLHVRLELFNATGCCQSLILMFGNLFNQFLYGLKKKLHVPLDDHVFLFGLVNLIFDPDHSFLVIKNFFL
jgi:hypothetical protein